MLIAAACLATALPVAWIAANTVSSPARGKEPRFPQLTLDQLNDQQRPVGEKIVKISSVGLGGPYNPLLRSPVYAQRMYDLLDYLRWHTSVPTKLNEMAILVVSRQWRSQVEWYAHAPLAKKAGLADSIIADLKANKRPAGMSPEEEPYQSIASLGLRVWILVSTNCKSCTCVKRKLSVEERRMNRS